MMTEKICNGKRYDISYSEMLGLWVCEEGTAEYSSVWEWLFKTEDGDFFVYRMATRDAKKEKLEEDIAPLTLEEAKTWVTKHLDADDYNRYFGKEE